MVKYDLIPIDQAHKDVESGNALLVCAYGSDEKFQNNALKGACPLTNFSKGRTSVICAKN